MPVMFPWYFCSSRIEHQLGTRNYISPFTGMKTWSHRENVDFKSSFEFRFWQAFDSSCFTFSFLIFKCDDIIFLADMLKRCSKKIHVKFPTYTRVLYLADIHIIYLTFFEWRIIVVGISKCWMLGIYFLFLTANYFLYLSNSCLIGYRWKEMHLKDIGDLHHQYGCESWTIKKAEHQRINTFELWCWRTLESLLDRRRSNQLILKETNSELIWKTDDEA